MRLAILRQAIATNHHRQHWTRYGWSDGELREIGEIRRQEPGSECGDLLSRHAAPSGGPCVLLRLDTPIQHEARVFGFQPDECIQQGVPRCVYASWHALLDAFIWLEAEDPRFMLDWRVEAEKNARAAGRGGMTTEQVTAFAARFLPAYLAYLPQLAIRPPITGPMLTVMIGRDRLPKNR